jgi:hypothetical protein
MDDVEVNYYDPRQPGSYAGVDKLYRSLDKTLDKSLDKSLDKPATRQQLKTWLSGEDAYTLHKPVSYTFPRNKVIVSGIDHQWDVDLIDMSRYRGKNDGYTFIFLATDILSHYVWTRALKNKSAAELVKTFKSVFDEGRRPQQIRTDRGTEFRNALVKQLLKEEHVHHFLTNNLEKANYAERANRTLKLKISRYFTHRNTHRWIDVLQDITSSYNNTYHRTIKMKPSEVTEDNQNDAWETQYNGPMTYKPDGPFKFDVGDTVRISHLKRTFQREYDERYTGEIFRVHTRKVRARLNVYTLIDFLDEEVQGTFYQPELQKITADPEGVFKIDKVLRNRIRKGHEKEFLVKWLHWPDKFNSWIKASDMHDI